MPNAAKSIYSELPERERKIALEKQCDEVVVMDVRHTLTSDEIRENNIQIGKLMSKISKIEGKISKLTEQHISPLKEEIKDIKKVLNPIVRSNAKGFDLITGVKCYRVTDPDEGKYGKTYFFNEDGVIVEERRATSEELENLSIFNKLKAVE